MCAFVLGGEGVHKRKGSGGWGGVSGGRWLRVRSGGVGGGSSPYLCGREMRGGAGAHQQGADAHLDVPISPSLRTPPDSQDANTPFPFTSLLFLTPLPSVSILFHSCANCQRGSDSAKEWRMGWVLQRPPHAPPTVPAASGQLLSPAAVLLEGGRDAHSPSTDHLLPGLPPAVNHQTQLPSAADDQSQLPSANQLPTNCQPTANHQTQLPSAADDQTQLPSANQLPTNFQPTANHQTQLPSGADPAGLAGEPLFANLCFSCHYSFKKERRGQVNDEPWSKEMPVTAGSRSGSGTQEAPAVGSTYRSGSGTLEMPAIGSPLKRMALAVAKGRQQREDPAAAERVLDAAEGAPLRGEAALEGGLREESAPAAEEEGQPREVPSAERSRGGVRAPPPPPPPPHHHPLPPRRPRRRESYDDVPAELGGVPVYRGSSSRLEGTR